MNRHRRPTSSGWVLIVLSAAALALGACGRKGPLDLPPNASSPAMASANSAPAPTDTQAEAMSKPSSGYNSSYGSEGPPSAPKGPKRPFILDPLLDSGGPSRN